MTYYLRGTHVTLNSLCACNVKNQLVFVNMYNKYMCVYVIQ